MVDNKNEGWGERLTFITMTFGEEVMAVIKKFD